ncbi:ABC transporter ATP-binding protein [Allokutzneria sp. NRRL B-24872]|uniref:ABC transporter ATP-binding protein n=1 Tax=Allokutzneria sp. NRRL B-24872 TaxID=1137961 RepID=UPI000A3C906B|nr:ABC transporter ATP-binding protein [Allokutzneria sp. NRRL B-24872]
MKTAGYTCRDLGVSFPGAAGERSILDGVSLDIAQGEIIVIVGRSGTGKTTLLRALGGLVLPTTGTLQLGGRDIDGPPTEVVMVFQDYAHALLPWRTVRRNVALGLEGDKKLTPAEREELVDSALEVVGLSARAEDRPWQLSGGMQQRVQIARALALRPRVLLMDEPFGALDAMTKASLQDELLAVQGRTSATIVFITHDIDEAIYLADRVMVIDGAPGRITHDIAVDLPRPRDQLRTKELPRYLALRRQVHEAVTGGPDD